MIVRHHGLLNSIVSNQGLVFMPKFWSLLCYFLGIRQRLFNACHLLTDSQTESQNSTIEVYLWAFVNYKQNN